MDALTLRSRGLFAINLKIRNMSSLLLLPGKTFASGFSIFPNRHRANATARKVGSFSAIAHMFRRDLK
jgi:hypothetical protein